MTTKEKRNEIYQWINKNIIVGNDKKWQDGLSKLLKEYSAIVLEECPRQQKKNVPKDATLKVAPKVKEIIRPILSGLELKESDIKRGIWRPDSHYGI